MNTTKALIRLADTQTKLKFRCPHITLHKAVNPGPAEPGYAMPLQTVSI